MLPSLSWEFQLQIGGKVADDNKENAIQLENFG